MKYEGSWRRITLSESNYYAHMFHRDWDKLNLEMRELP
jgi:hypothetical protein